jgi:hypothetical protein
MCDGFAVSHGKLIAHCMFPCFNPPGMLGISHSQQQQPHPSYIPTGP